MKPHEGDSIDEGLQSVLCAFLRLLPRPEVSFDAREHSFGWHHVVTGDLPLGRSSKSWRPLDFAFIHRLVCKEGSSIRLFRSQMIANFMDSAKLLFQRLLLQTASPRFKLHIPLRLHTTPELFLLYRMSLIVSKIDIPNYSSKDFELK